MRDVRYNMLIPSEGSRPLNPRKLQCPVFTVHANLALLQKCKSFLVLRRVEIHRWMDKYIISGNIRQALLASCKWEGSW